MNVFLRLAAATLCAIVLSACGNITPESYDRIEDGMSEAAVIGILGTPTESAAVSILGVTGKSSTWVGAEYSIMLHFVNDKVRLKSLGRTSSR